MFIPQEIMLISSLDSIVLIGSHNKELTTSLDILAKYMWASW
jgi:hypothetical protein